LPHFSGKLRQILALRAKMNVTEGHFYTDNGQIPVSNLAALKAL
jgi:hypothetical protein